MSKKINALEKFLAAERVGLARMISLIENRSAPLLINEWMSKIYDKLRYVPVLGVTGPPGAGKSTLVNQLIKNFRAQDKTVGIVAIDPSSPFSGGAVLGDRIRMQEHAGDEGVFIRSLGSRGAHGGLSRATRDVVQLFDAFGMDQIIVETVGVGQTELDIMELASTTLVVLTPESGDTIQTMKAGLLEAADIFAVNKADREGAGKIALELETMIALSEAHANSEAWQIPVLQAQAFHNVGMAEINAAVQQHEDFIRQNSEYDERIQSLRYLELQAILNEKWQQLLDQKISEEAAGQALEAQVRQGEESPYVAADKMMQMLMN